MLARTAAPRCSSGATRKAGFVALIKGTADSQQQLEKTAEAIGTTAQQLEALQFAAGSQGIGEDQFTRALTKLNSALGENQKQLLETRKKQEDLVTQQLAGKITAGQANSEFLSLNDALAKNINVFNRLGIVTTKADGTLRDTADILKDVADVFHDLPDGAEKSALAIQLFGTRNAQIVSLLNKGSAGIAKLTAEAERVAPALSPIEIAINQRLASAFTTLEKSATSVKNAFTTLFAPAVTTLVDGLTEAIVQNREAFLAAGAAIADKVTPIVNDLVAALQGRDQDVKNPAVLQVLNDLKSFATDAGKAITDILLPAFKGLLFVLNTIAEAFNGLFGTKLSGEELGVAAAILKIVGAFGLVRTAISVVVAIVGFLIATFGAVPVVIGLIVVALAAFVVKALGGIDGIKDKWTKGWAAIRDFVTGVFDKLKNAGQAVADGVASAWTGTVDAVKTAASEIADFFSSTWDSVKQGASDVVDSVVGFFTDLPGKIGDAFNSAADAVSSVFADFVKQAGAVRDGIVSAFSDTVSQVTDFFNNLPTNLQAAFDALLKLASDTWDALVAKASAIASGIVDSFRSGLQSVSDLFKSLTDGAISLLQKIADTASSVAQAVASAFNGGSGNPAQDAGAAPGFARGGFVRGPGTSRSDSIPAWVSNGEFINNARSVRHYGADFFEALNRMALPKFAALGASLRGFSPDLSALMPGIPRFADGGLVGGAPALAGTGRPLVLHIAGQTIHATAPAGELDALERAATGKQIRSAGRKPTWFRG